MSQQSRDSAGEEAHRFQVFIHFLIVSLVFPHWSPERHPSVSFMCSPLLDAYSACFPMSSLPQWTLFLFLWYWVWTKGFMLTKAGNVPLEPLFQCDRVSWSSHFKLAVVSETRGTYHHDQLFPHWDGVMQMFYPDWLGTTILWISASRITVMSHWHPSCHRL
jgi:hypothetical protein